MVIIIVSGWILNVRVLERVRVNRSRGIGVIWVRCIVCVVFTGYARMLTGIMCFPFSQSPNNRIGKFFSIENNLMFNSDLFFVRKIDPITGACRVKANEVSKTSAMIDLTGIDDLLGSLT